MTTSALPRRDHLGERRRRWLHAAAELTEELDAAVGTDTGAALIAARARSTAHATAAAVVRFPAGSHPVISAGDGLPAAGITVLVRRVIAEARSAHQHVVALDVDLDQGYAHVVPLPTHLTAPGTLVVFHDHPPGQDAAEDRELLARYAEHAGLALDRAEAVRERAELALLAERNRIARDLHDVVIQRLFAAGLMLDAARGASDARSQDARIDEIVAELDETIAAIRTTIFALGPGGS